jgi:hypothetical protein
MTTGARRFISGGNEQAVLQSRAIDCRKPLPPVRHVVVSTINRPNVVDYLDTAATLVIAEAMRAAADLGA